jgi:hypothetical protein
MANEKYKNIENSIIIYLIILVPAKHWGTSIHSAVSEPTFLRSVLTLIFRDF